MLICSSQVISIQKGLFSKWTVQSYSGQQAHLRNSSKHVTWQNDSASGGPGDSESRRGVRAPTGRRRGRLRVPRAVVSHQSGQWATHHKTRRAGNSRT